MRKIAELCKSDRYHHYLYAKAGTGDPEAAGIAKLTYLATNYTPEEALRMLHKSIGVATEEEEINYGG